MLPKQANEESKTKNETGGELVDSRRGYVSEDRVDLSNAMSGVVETALVRTSTVSLRWEIRSLPVRWKCSRVRENSAAVKVGRCMGLTLTPWGSRMPSGSIPLRSESSLA